MNQQNNLLRSIYIEMFIKNLDELEELVFQRIQAERKYAENEAERQAIIENLCKENN